MTNQTPSNSVVTDLKPCPFCGSEKLTAHCDTSRDDIHIFFVMCDKCGAEGPSLYADTPPFSYQFDDFNEDCRNVARHKWNTRPLAMQSAPGSVVTEAMIVEIQEAAMADTEMYVGEKMVRAIIERFLAMQPCAHDWHYRGTDYRGSHKGEDAYKCSRCGKYEYRP